MSQLLIKNGSCAFPGVMAEADLLVDEGRIVAIGRNLAPTAETVIDGRGLFVLPGGIDVHVHLPWPFGAWSSADDLSSGTMAAAFGGVTSILDFAIPSEGQGLAEALSGKLEAAAGRAWVDYSFHLNLRGEIEAQLAEIDELVRGGFPSFKVFMAYEGFRLDDSQLLRAMDAVAQAGGVLTAHCENGPLADHLSTQLVAQNRRLPADYPLARPAPCEVEAIHRLLTYTQRIGTRTHIHHVSTGRGARLIGRARRQGLPVTGETCPHYLLFSSEDYRGDAKRAAHLVCAPSIKGTRDRETLWRLLAAGDLSVVATDHCPYSRQQKEEHLDDFSQIPGGMAGVETRLPLLFTEGVMQGRLSLERMVEVWATEPAKAFGLYPRKGIIAIGSDADLVLLNPRSRGVLLATELHMNTDCLPYEGREVYGLPVTTILRGQLVVREGQLAQTVPCGELVPRRLGAEREGSRWERP